MTMLFMLGGASGTVSFTPIPFGKTCALLAPDEVAIGATWELSMEVFDDTGNYALDRAAEWYLTGFTAAGARVAVHSVAQMAQVGSSNVWTTTVPAITTAGIYEVTVVGMVATVAFVATRAITVRPKYAPLALADTDILAERTDGNETIITQ